MTFSDKNVSNIKEYDTDNIDLELPILRVEIEKAIEKIKSDKIERPDNLNTNHGRSCN